jgi:acetyl-CoA carboxylase carboxyltransferase component
MFDLKIAAEGAKVYLTAEKDEALDADLICKSEDEAFAAARKLIELLPSNNKDCAIMQVADPAERAVTADVQDTRALLDDICDAGNVLVLGEQKKDGMLTALATVGGVTVGVVATDRAQNGGKLTHKGARRAASLISLCDSLHIPVVTLVDSEGIAPKCTSCGVKAYGALSGAYATATCAKVTVVTGNAYGAAFTLLGSRAQGADLTLALPESCISAMDPAAAVAFLYNDEITQDKSRAEVEAAYKATKASAQAAAEKGDIDDIVPAEELRARICAALYMLGSKADGALSRRHANLPL